MHYAKIVNSDRLQRVYDVLLAATKPLSTLDIIVQAHICAVSAAISELRHNDIPVSCKESGGRYYYWLD
jgi:hypothetical protein